jgi:hypothetical protein
LSSLFERQLSRAALSTMSREKAISYQLNINININDLFEKAVVVGPLYKPLTEAETGKLQEMAKTYVSQFQREEQGVTMHSPAYYDCPHSLA